MMSLLFLGYIFLYSIIVSNISSKVLEVLISTLVLVITGFIISKSIVRIKNLNKVNSFLFQYHLFLVA